MENSARRSVRGPGEPSAGASRGDSTSAWLEAPAGRASFDRIAAVAARATGAPIAAVTLADGAQQVLVGFSGEIQPLAARRTLPLRGSFLERLVRRRAGITVTDARTDPEMQGIDTTEDLGLVAYAGAPIVDEDGTV
ncbi:MAG: hypothetical protein QOH46_2519, partial [Solirubrobacteraceae bacterium]|nr:hypothetical protein [Solirubrobacteraceae bacterium]